MGRSHVPLAAVLLASLAGGPVLASPLDDLFARHAEPSELATLREFAACKAERYPAAAQTALRGDLGTAQIQTRYPDLTNTPQCFKAAVFHNKRMVIADGLYQGFLAEAMLRHDYTATSLPDIGRVPPLPREVFPVFDESQLSEKLRTDFVIVRESAAFDVVAECVARAAPAAVYHFVTSRPDSADEGNEFAALQGTITPCLTAGNLGAYPAFAWRTTLAHRLYRLVDAARPVSHDAGVPHA